MSNPTRLRQVALVAAELAPVADLLAKELELPAPFHDPGISEFGLENAVFAAGDTFIEIVAPVRPDTTAGRLLDKRGGDGGYMAIFQVPDIALARRRLADNDIKIVWQSDLGDISGTHLHPRDVPGAIVSIDWADPPESWHWAGPDWRGGAPAQAAAVGPIAGITVTGGDAEAVAARWALAVGERVGRDGDDGVIAVDGGRQTLRFTGGAGEPAITDVAVFLAAGAQPRESVNVCGVKFAFVEGVES